MITIYTPYPTARLNYVLSYLFTEQMGVQWQLLKEIEINTTKTQFCINYSDKETEGCLHILPVGLLSEIGIRTYNIEVVEYNDLKVLFKNDSNLGYDIFSAIFYCLSRYEEYENVENDSHGRFKYSNSFLWKYNCLNLPLVDLWIKDFKELLVNSYHFKIDDFKTSAFSVLPTIDIDAVFAYKGRNILRQIIGFSKSLFEFNFKEIIKRFKTSYLNETDPNDNFYYQFEQLRKNRQSANYFIQIGNYGRYDKNLKYSNQSFQKIIHSISEKGHIIGLHPSYQSNSDINIIRTEKEKLENIIHQKIINTRQHYLRFNLPTTYQTLIKLGFQKEYSMGYSEVTGFRASTSKSFKWYDIENEKATDLEIIPFCVMDVAYKQFSKLTPAEAIIKSNEIKQTIQSVQGVFCFVFHNESLSNHRGWEGWHQVFETWLKDENTLHTT